MLCQLYLNKSQKKNSKLIGRKEEHNQKWKMTCSARSSLKRRKRKKKKDQLIEFTVLDK